MTVRSPYQVHAKTDPWWGDRPPRGYTRNDRVDLNLFDAGHGDPTYTRNPILLGMGVTLKLRLNPFVRTWKVFVTEVGGTEVEITSQFVKVTDDLYELRGVAGAGAFNPEVRAPSGWASPISLDFRVETRNVKLTNEFNAQMTIQDSDDIRSCPDACQLDFPLLRKLHGERVRIWRDVIDPGRTPGDEAYDFLIYLFDQAVFLKNLTQEICGCYNYHELVMIGVKFFIVGDCEVSSLATEPNLPDFNPWDEVTLPQFLGEDIILPARS